MKVVLKTRKISHLVMLAFLVISLVACSNQNEPSEKANKISFANVEFKVEVADTKGTRTKGLSGTESLDQNKGLLFDFKEEGNYGFWMKDMAYSLDIIWLDRNLKVVHIEESVSPDTYPKSFYSPEPARYVLEINSGLTSKYKIRVGDKSTIS